MKLAHPLEAHTSPRAHIASQRDDLLVALALTLLPYLVAAIGLFAYHEQWFR